MSDLVQMSPTWRRRPDVPLAPGLAEQVAVCRPGGTYTLPQPPAGLDGRAARLWLDDQSSAIRRQDIRAKVTR